MRQKNTKTQEQNISKIVFGYTVFMLMTAMILLKIMTIGVK